MVLLLTGYHQFLDLSVNNIMKPCCGVIFLCFKVMRRKIKNETVHKEPRERFNRLCADGEGVGLIIRLDV